MRVFSLLGGQPVKALSASVVMLLGSVSFIAACSSGHEQSAQPTAGVSASGKMKILFGNRPAHDISAARGRLSPQADRNEYVRTTGRIISDERIHGSAAGGILIFADNQEIRVIDPAVQEFLAGNVGRRVYIKGRAVGSTRQGIVVAVDQYRLID